MRHLFALLMFSGCCSVASANGLYSFEQECATGNCPITAGPASCVAIGVDSRGGSCVLTAAHCVEQRGNRFYVVSKHKQKTRATLVWKDDQSDIAVLRVGRRLSLSKSSGSVTIGETAILNGLLTRRLQESKGRVRSVTRSNTQLWVADMSEDVWPAAARPDPFLPLAWQRRMGMPHADADREREFAKRITQRLVGSANHVIFSHPMRKDEQDLAPSPLIAELPVGEVGGYMVDTWRERIASGSTCEEIQDVHGTYGRHERGGRGGTMVSTHGWLEGDFAGACRGVRPRLGGRGTQLSKGLRIL